MKLRSLKLISLFVILGGSCLSQVTPTIVHTADQATYALGWKEYKLENLGLEVLVDGKWVKATDFPIASWSMKTGEVNRISRMDPSDGAVGLHELTLSGRSPLKTLILQVEVVENRPYVVVAAKVTAASEFQLGGVRLLTCDKVAIFGKSDANTLFLEAVEAPHDGRIIRPWMLDPTRYNVETNGKQAKLDPSFWVTLLTNDSANQTLVGAAIEGELWPTSFKWNWQDETCVGLKIISSSVTGREKVFMRKDASVNVDKVMLGLWSNIRPTQVLAEAGRIMGKNVRRDKPMRQPLPGWSSWHSAARNVSEKGIMESAKFVRANMYDSGWKMIQLDGGWWTTQGSYTVNNDFPHGIRWLADEIRGMGLEFGLHVSPFRANPNDPFIKAHPAWVLKPYSSKKVKKDDDEMITTIGGVYLDGSNPEVAPFLAGQFRTMVEAYKPVFMKWDHHYGSLEEGSRFDPTMTGLQSHNKVVRMIRAALPEDLIITRSMGWLYGAIECYDAIRVGNDINHPGMGEGHPDKPNSTNMTYGKTLGPIENVYFGKGDKGLVRFARSVAQNYYIHRNIAINDPDAFFVTEQYTEDEAKCHITLQAIMGGIFFMGDLLQYVPAERLALAKNKDLMAINQERTHAVPIDLFKGPDIPRIWKLELKDRVICALYNWLDTPIKSTYTFADLELAPADYKLKEIWTGEQMKLADGGLTFDEKPHSVRLIEFRK